MLPRLEAQRELASINAMTVAFGSMRRFDRQRYVGRLSQAAQGASGAATPATPEALAAMGINVVIAPAKAPPEEAANG
jgi:hypothetical protein